MIRKVLIFLVAAGFFAGCVADQNATSDSNEPSPDNKDPETDTTTVYRIATYNIRRITNEKEPEREWPVRRPFVKRIITEYEFDILGVQEPLGKQIDDMVADLPIYSRFGVSDHDDYIYQHQDIFYRSSQFSLLKKGHFWLAPDGPATLPDDTKPWDNQYHATVVTWGKFEDKTTEFQFYIFNAHFDPGGAMAKQKSAELMLKKISEIAGSSPVIFMGDLNSNQQTDPFLILNNSNLLQETWDLAQVKTPDSRQTGNWWDTSWDYNSQIDHIFVTSHWYVSSRHVLHDTYDGIFPSDHYPVLVRMNLNNPETQ